MDPARIKHHHYCLNGRICSPGLEKYPVPSGLKIKKRIQYLKYFCYIRKESYRQLGSLQSSQCRRRQHPKDTTTECEGHELFQVISARAPAHKAHWTPYFSDICHNVQSCLFRKKQVKEPQTNKSHIFSPYLSTHPTSAIASIPIFLQMIYIFLNKCKFSQYVLSHLQQELQPEFWMPSFLSVYCNSEM